MAKVGHLPPVRQVSCFVSGLKEGIKADVLVGRPTDLSMAIGLARLYEARNSSLRQTPVTVPATTRVAPQVSREDAPPRTPLAVR